MPGPTPVSVSRPARHGKIRWGVKNAKGWPEAIDTFRFTSSDKVAIGLLAEEYGGVVESWNDPAATERNQWQVISETNEITVWIVPGQMWRGYEEWRGGVCYRRCDGVTLDKLVDTPDGSEMLSMACMCGEAGVMTCRPKLRLEVILPNVPMGGVWAIESRSWNAWHEMPNLVHMLEVLQGSDRSIEPARFLLTDQSKKVRANGKTMTRRFKVPKLILPRTAKEILENVSGVPSNVLASRVEVLAEIVDVPELAPVEIIDVVEERVEESVVEGGKEVVVSVMVWGSLAEVVKAGHTRDQVEKREGKWCLK